MRMAFSMQETAVCGFVLSPKSHPLVLLRFAGRKCRHVNYGRLDAFLCTGKSME